MPNIEDIFKDLHGAFDKSKLIKLKDIVGKNTSVPTLARFKEAVKALNVDSNYIFYDPESYLNSYIYLEGPVFISLYNLDPVLLGQMRVGEMISKQKKMFDESIAKKDYDRVFTFMDKKLIIPNYIEMYPQIPDDQKYEIFVDLHVRSEFGFEMFSHEFLKDVFSKRFNSLDWKERMEKLNKDAKIGQDGTILVYHGHNPTVDPKDEYSWTLKLETAKFFAKRFGANGKISKMRIKPEIVIDYFPQRGEAEIILMPK